MAKVFMICGKLCSGKSTYAETLRKKHSAVILSVDEIMLTIFGQNAGEKHDDYLKKHRNIFTESHWIFWKGTPTLYWIGDFRQKKKEILLKISTMPKTYRLNFIT